MEKKNNRGRTTNLFKCFKPPAFDHDDDDDRLFDSYSSSPPPYSAHQRTSTKRRLHRSFSGSLTSLVKRLRSKKARKGSSRSSSTTDSSPSRGENVTKSKGLLMHSEEILRTSSAPSILFSSSPMTMMTSSSSSRSSSISSNSRSNSLNLKQTKLESGKYSGCARPLTLAGGIMSFMVCLVCVVLWGKVFAILACTSTWLYFAPTRTHISDSDSVVYSDEYRKKVILQGLLERDCSYMRT